MKTPTPKKPPVPKPSQSSATADHPTPVGTVRNCTTCAHMYHSKGAEQLGLEFAKCAVSSRYVEIARKHRPDICDENFSRWEPKVGVEEKHQVDQEKLFRGIPQWLRQLIQGKQSKV